MRDHKHPHPLYSFQAWESPTPALTLQTDHGPLCISGALAVRARKYTSATCLQAVRVALRAHQGQLGWLAGQGFPAAWAEHMGYWRDELARLEGARAANLQERQQQRGVQLQLIGQGRRLWTHVSQAAKEAQLQPPPTRGLQLSSATSLAPAVLSRLLLRLQESATAEKLAPHGFSADALQELAKLTVALEDNTHLRQQLEGSFLQHSAQSLVIRGALLGDLARLSRIAGTRLPIEQARRFQMQSLLSPWRTPSLAPGEP